MSTQQTASRAWPMWLATVGLLLVMMATLAPILRLVEGDIYKYVYSAGAVMVLVGRLFSPYRGDVLRLKRLYRIEAWVGIFFCVGAFFLFYRGHGIGPTDWLAFTLAGGIIQIYTSIMIPRVSRKQG